MPHGISFFREENMAYSETPTKEEVMKKYFNLKTLKWIAFTALRWVVITATLVVIEKCFTTIFAKEA